MDVTLLYFEDCPNWLDTDRHLTALAQEIPDLVISRQLVDTPEEAERTGFRGSPSVLINGVDPFGDPDAPTGMSCRVYQTPAGPAGTPTIEQLRQAIVGG